MRITATTLAIVAELCARTVVTSDTAGPRLNIQLSGSSVVISWATPFSNYVLQASDSLMPSAVWATVADAPIGLASELVVTNGLSAKARFYRLIQTDGTALPIPSGAFLDSVLRIGVPWDVTEDFSSPEYGVPGYDWGSVPQIVSFANRDGSLDVAWLDTKAPPQIFITHFGKEGGGYKATWHLKVHTLDRLGGFTRDDNDNMFYLTTIAETLQRQPEPHGVQRPDIAHLVKLDPYGTELFRTDLRTDFSGNGATPLYSPMTWGTSRIAVGGGNVIVTFTCNTEFDPGVQSRHQRQIYLIANVVSGKLNGYYNGISHSWDQRLIYDGTAFVGTSLGDASLRGIGVAKIGVASPRVAFAVKGGDPSTVPGYQNTFTRLGDLEPGTTGYALLFSTERSTQYAGGNSAVVSSRNLALVHVRNDFETVAANRTNQYDVAIVDTTERNSAAETFNVGIKDYWGSKYEGKNKGIVWLTHYEDRATENVERPKLVSLGNGRFIALWEKWSLNSYTETFAMVIDEYGHVAREALGLGNGVRLHRQDSAIRLNNKAAWVVGKAIPAEFILYTLDENLNLDRYEIK